MKKSKFMTLILTVREADALNGLLNTFLEGLQIMGDIPGIPHKRLKDVISLARTACDAHHKAGYCKDPKCTYPKEKLKENERPN